jgi:hypothetical protein
MGHGRIHVAVSADGTEIVERVLGQGWWAGPPLIRPRAGHAGDYPGRCQRASQRGARAGPLPAIADCDPTASSGSTLSREGLQPADGTAEP